MIARPPNEPVYDVLIIGAGPCGLATASRLRESHPSALFTDVEQARYSWISRTTSIKNKRTGRIQGSTSPKSPDLNILVLDSAGETFMARWHALFSRLRIEYLRSPMFFHPDPRDRDALLAFCHGGVSSRESTMQEIAGCVGKELSKHRHKKNKKTSHGRGGGAPRDINERDRQDYFAPSAKAFKQFCEQCVTRYELAELVQQETVLDIQYGDVLDQKLFTIRTASGTIYRSRTAVLALGGGDPQIPHPFHLQHGSLTHALSLHTPLLPSSLAPHAHIAILGGGLTSAQCADSILRSPSHSQTILHILMRSHWKTKPFDVDLAWMGKYANHAKAEFWTSEDLDERLDMAKRARGGGSISPRWTRVLKSWMKSGRVVVYEDTCVEAAEWDDSSRVWTLTTNPARDIPAVAHVLCATGLSSDITTLPCVSSLYKSNPIPSHSGFPALTPDLAWHEDIPLFVTGKLAMLQLGPGAGNLEGARVGAERVAWGVNKYLSRAGGADVQTEDGMEESEDEEGVVERYVMGIGGKFDGLVAEGEDSGVEL